MSYPYLSINAAVSALHQGQVVAYPTEAVYGLGCDPLNQQAVERIWQLKQRPAAMGLILVAADWSQLVDYVAPLSAAQLDVLQQPWPGAHTWIVPAAKQTPSWLTGGRQTIAVRVSAHPVIQQLCQAYRGAIVSTSANLHQQPPLADLDALHATFSAQAGFAGIVAGALGAAGRPTPIQDFNSKQWIRV